MLVGDAGRAEDVNGLSLPGWTILPGATPRGGCDGGTPIAPQNRGFSGGRSRHYGRRNRNGPILVEGAIRPANTGRSGAATGPARCDSGCNRGVLTESHAGAAKLGDAPISLERHGVAITVKVDQADLLAWSKPQLRSANPECQRGVDRQRRGWSVVRKREGPARGDAETTQQARRTSATSVVSATGCLNRATSSWTWRAAGRSEPARERKPNTTRGASGFLGGGLQLIQSLFQIFGVCDDFFGGFGGKKPSACIRTMGSYFNRVYALYFSSN